MAFRTNRIELFLLLLMHALIYCNSDEVLSESEGYTRKPRLAPPHHVKAVQVGKSDVLVTWEMSESHRIQNLTYRVSYAPIEDKNKWKKIDVPSSQEAVIGGLTQGETYTIRVSAVSRQEPGHMSHPVKISIHHRDNCLRCKREEESNFHCNCSHETLDETCKEVCRFKCKNFQGFHQTNGCKDGCITGWYGQFCSIRCPDRCLECDAVTGHCTTCASHESGLYCNETCPAGLYGAGCNKLCPAHCSRCLNHSYCNECKTGRYGKSCESLCHSDCLACIDEPQKCTSCIDGKFLDTGNVCSNCTENCMTCTGEEDCTKCEIGKYGQKCKMSCPPKCVSCTDSDNCDQCAPDRHGDRCECNSKCRNVTEQCDTGEVCQKGCPPMKMGIYCSHPCPKSCFQCDQLTGNCISCKNGLYGHNCSQTCGHCKRNNQGEIKCNKQTGKCEDCTSGWYGWRCNESCSTGCQTLSCDQLTGNCDVCKNGFYGPRCNEQCSENCYNVSIVGCEYCPSPCNTPGCQTLSCDRFTGNCDVCKNGYYGPRCNEQCSKNCYNVSIVGCNKKSGYCIDGCNPGWYDEYCQSPCNTTGCQTLSCDRFTGNCDVCENGFYGPDCNEHCSKNCYNVSIVGCNKQSGYCIHGCNKGWYSEYCQSPCSVTCVNNLCHQDTGVCQLGCVDGFTGDTCSLNINREYMISLDVRQIGAQNVLIQWDKLNFTDIVLESVKRVMLNHKMLGTTAVDVHDVFNWKTKSHFLLRDIDPNNKHTFQLVILFNLLSQTPLISKPEEFELVPRASDDQMLHLTSDMELYNAELRREYYDYSYRYMTRCTQIQEENILNPDRWDKITTQEIKCYVGSKGEVKATEIKFFKDDSERRKLIVGNEKLLTWIMAHF